MTKPQPILMLLTSRLFGFHYKRDNKDFGRYAFKLINNHLSTKDIATSLAPSRPTVQSINLNNHHENLLLSNGSPLEKT